MKNMIKEIDNISKLPEDQLANAYSTWKLGLMSEVVRNGLHAKLFDPLIRVDFGNDIYKFDVRDLSATIDLLKDAIPNNLNQIYVTTYPGYGNGIEVSVPVLKNNEPAVFQLAGKRGIVVIDAYLKKHARYINALGTVLKFILEAKCDNATDCHTLLTYLYGEPDAQGKTFYNTRDLTKL